MDDSLGVGALERQVVEAALATTRPTSSPTERSEASASLERWTAGGGGGGSAADDAACWEAYLSILRISFGTRSAARSDPPSSGASAPVAGHSRQSSGASSAGSGDGDAVERIAYATSPARHRPLTSDVERQIRAEAHGAKLLLVTLFSTKIRRELVRLLRDHPPLAGRVFDELLAALASFRDVEAAGADKESMTLMGACCTAAAAAAVRASTPRCMNEGIMRLAHSCRAAIAASLGMVVNESTYSVIPLSPTVALRLLADIPGEAESRSDMTTIGIDALLQMPHADVALEALHLALSSYIGGGGERQDALLCSTLSALAKWAEACKRHTRSRLSEPTDGNPSTILSQLVALLSSQSQQRQWTSAKYAEEALLKSAHVLKACIENTSDYGTQSRRTATASLLASITSPTEFLVAPIKFAERQQWEDAMVALSNLAAALAREEIDEISTCRLPGCTDLVELLLELQAHPIHNAAVPVLEVWLALQDVPTSERHPTLAASLYQHLTEVILNRVAYPSEFVSWEEELLDESDFDEFRRLSTDVLVGSYYLLRSGYLETLANVVMTTADSTDWQVVESALFCLCAVGREACARVKSVKNAVSTGRDSPVAADGEATSVGLTQMVGSICAGGVTSVPRRHPLVLSGIANFLGCYATIWAATCPPQTILEMLAFLSAVLSVPAAMESGGKSIRLVLVSSAKNLSKAATSPGADVAVALTQLMEAALATNNANVMKDVAEGCARVSVQLRDKSKTRATLSAVAAPTIHRVQSALDVIISASSVQGSGQAAGQVDAASQALASYLIVLRELIRFCDGSPSGRDNESHVLSDVLAAAWPVLKGVSASTSCRANESVLGGLLDVHSQLLSVVPSLIGPYFKDLTIFVVKAYEESFCPSSLAYISAAVETFDTEESIAKSAGLDEIGKETIFNQLLGHICQCTFTFVTQTRRPDECTQVIQHFFEMAQRYLLFCPRALISCPEFSSLFALAVACLTECRGEVHSTRATLIFLTQLIGWKHIRLQEAKVATLSQFAGTIDNLLAQHGETILKSCVGGLSGPQILWPSFSECIFSIMLHIISSNPAANEPNSILCTWLRSAMNDCSSMEKSPNITPEIEASVITILCDLAKEGNNSKQKAKMVLVDFGKIAKGEATTDALLAYSIA